MTARFFIVSGDLRTVSPMAYISNVAPPGTMLVTVSSCDTFPTALDGPLRGAQLRLDLGVARPPPDTGSSAEAWMSALGAERNRLLAALPATEYQRLTALLEPVPLTFQQVLYEPEETVTHIYFPRKGMLSLLVVLEDGAAVEVAAVGAEGMVGLRLLFGSTLESLRVVCQLPGEAVRIERAAFQSLLAEGSSLRELLFRYTHARCEQIMQIAACNRHHETRQRFARWLLTVHDQAQADTFPVTQEFLANMLDVRRPTLTAAARTFQETGLIRYGRGHLTILDRAALEALACECYRRIRAIYGRMLG